VLTSPIRCRRRGRRWSSATGSGTRSATRTLGPATLGQPCEHTATQAGPGEILDPDTVRGLLSGKRFLFTDRGEFVPKGFDDAVRLYEVRWQQEAAPD
jgi:hypothetical protein